MGMSLIKVSPRNHDTSLCANLAYGFNFRTDSMRENKTHSSAQVKVREI